MEFMDLHPFVKQTVIDKVYGCITGSALGDAIGLYCEFKSKDACGQQYPERKFSLVEPVTESFGDMHRDRFEKCGWTDDTDQALLIILSYLQSQDITQLPQDFAERLHIWLDHGLIALDRLPCGIGNLVGSVVKRPEYLQDPTKIATEEWRKRGCTPAPNGSLMRTHPIGVIGISLSEEETWKLAAAVGRTTHVDPRCTVSCCIVVSVIRGILRGDITVEAELDKAIVRARNWVLKQPELLNPGLDPNFSEEMASGYLEPNEFARHVCAESFDELQLDDRLKMGYVYKCLGSALLCLRLAMRATQESPIPLPTAFEDQITDLITEGGDADTNGAVAGALLGVWFGHSALPLHWTRGLKHKQWLDSKISRFLNATGIRSEPLEVVSDEAPDGGRGLFSKEELDNRERELMFMLMNKAEKRREEEARLRNQGKGLGAWFKK